MYEVERVSIVVLLQMFWSNLIEKSKNCNTFFDEIPHILKYVIVKYIVLNTKSLIIKEILVKTLIYTLYIVIKKPGLIFYTKNDGVYKKKKALLVSH